MPNKVLHPTRTSAVEYLFGQNRRYHIFTKRGCKMAGEKVTMILRSRTDLPDRQIAKMSDAEGWQLTYSLKPRKSQIQRIPDQICFTGFSPSDKDRLGQIAVAHGLYVAKSVTQSLAFLVAGPNAGPAKLKKAREQEVIIMNEEQFARFLHDGRIPD